MEFPNYKEYSLDELYDALEHIEREQFPERTQTILNEIKAKKAPKISSDIENEPLVVQTDNTDKQADIATVVEEYKEDSSGNFFVRHWRGQLPLPVSYWVIGIAVNISVYVMNALIERRIENVASSEAIGFYILLLYVVMIILTTWQYVGIYRSASKHPLRGGTVGWAYAAKTMVFIGVFIFINQMYTTGYPIMKSGVNLILGINDIAETKFRVLNDGKDLEIMGGIEVGSELLLEEQFKLHPEIKTVHLHSSGGRVLAAERMLEFLKKQNIDTYVRGECASSCTLLFLAGNNKLLARDGKLQFHSSAVGSVSGHDVREFSERFKEVYLNEGLPKWFVNKIIETPSNTLWEPTTEQLLKAGVIDKLVNSDNYPTSALGTTEQITIESVSADLLSEDYIRAMKEHYPESYQKALDINLKGLKAGLPLIDIKREYLEVVLNADLLNYIANASDTALVNYFRSQVEQMKELQDQNPLTCASYNYIDVVPEEHHLGIENNQELLSEDAINKEKVTLAALIRSKGTHIMIDEAERESIIQELIDKIRAKNSKYIGVYASPADFVDQAELMCSASIALSEGMIAFDEAKSGQLLRNIFKSHSN